MSLKKPSFVNIPPYAIVLLFYCVIIFFITLADGLMSYISPIFIENSVNSTFLMGIIFASSSLVGIVCDGVFPNLFRAKRHLFFLWNTVLLALLFPAIFLFLPHDVPNILIAMAIWGIYYEFLVFSNAYFIEAFIKMERHGLAWGTLTTFGSISLFIAPLFAPYLIDKGENYPLIVTIALLLVGMVGILLFNKFFPYKKREVVKEEVTKRYGFLKELAIWRSLLKKVWPLYVFILAIFILEATFMSVGILATEHLRQESFWGSFLIAAYVLPSLFTGMLVQKLGVDLGKKRVAFICGTVGGLLIFVASFMPNPPLLVLVTFLGSCFTATAYPAIMAAMQDYVTRLGGLGSEMIGLRSASGSLGYVVGPIVAGILSTMFGDIRAIGVVGLFLCLIAILNIIIVPRKIHMPQKELEEITGLPESAKA